VYEDLNATNDRRLWRLCELETNLALAGPPHLAHGACLLKNGVHESAILATPRLGLLSVLRGAGKCIHLRTGKFLTFTPFKLLL
jgi:hypothetical protein